MSETKTAGLLVNIFKNTYGDHREPRRAIFIDEIEQLSAEELAAAYPELCRKAAQAHLASGTSLTGRQTQEAQPIRGKENKPVDR